MVSSDIHGIQQRLGYHPSRDVVNCRQQHEVLIFLALYGSTKYLMFSAVSGFKCVNRGPGFRGKAHQRAAFPRSYWCRVNTQEI